MTTAIATKSPWTFEACLEDAKRFETRNAWQKGSNAAWQAARYRGWLEQCYAHMRRDRQPSGTWQRKENVLADALKYKTRGEWQKKGSGSYHKALMYGWLDECSAHMDKLRVEDNYWTFERVKAEALKFSRRTEWRKNSPSSYGKAVQMKWLVECTAHMENMKKPLAFYTLEYCKAAAAKYSSRTQWKIESHVTYVAAQKQGWLDICCAHMPRMGNLHIRALYAFEFEDKSVYVGLTQDYEKRYIHHQGYSRWYAEKKALGVPYELKRFNTWYPAQQASIEEGLMLERYRANGWSVLNGIKTGALGGCNRKHTLESCVAQAKKYRTIKEWRETDSGSHAAARKYGWMEECRKYIRPAEQACNRKPVVCLESGQTYPSIRAAAQALGLPIWAVHKSVHVAFRVAGKYTFEFVSKEVGEKQPSMAA